MSLRDNYYQLLSLVGLTETPLPKGYVNNDVLARGTPYKQLYHAYPAMEQFYLAAEKTYDPEPVLFMMKDCKYVIPIGAVVLYCIMIYFGPAVVSKMKKPFKLEGPLALWNLFLSVFSFYGAFRTVPHLLWMLNTMTQEETVCNPAHLTFGGGAVGLASQLFCLSKIPELIDTLFIVLKGKRPIFLHWYHHITVLLYCWNSYVTESAAGIYFIAMNYTVHAVMYFYFFMQAIKCVPKWFPSFLITIMQISQMFIGMYIVGLTIYYNQYGGKKYLAGKCNNQDSTLVCGFIMYFSYFYLFVEFAVKKFIFGQEETAAVKPKKKAA